jgi:hypothetical protein
MLVDIIVPVHPVLGQAVSLVHVPMEIAPKASFLYATRTSDAIRPKSSFSKILLYFFDMINLHLILNHLFFKRGLGNFSNNQRNSFSCKI